MTSVSPGHRRKFSGKDLTSSQRPEKHWNGGGFAVTLKVPVDSSSESFSRPSKVLVNVSMEKCVGAVQVVISLEDTVADLIKAALASYKKEKRRPFLKNNNSKCYDLHYSSFALQSLKVDEKLMNLGSRNFFLCSRPMSSSYSEKENMVIDSAFSWMVFVPLLL
ncbi:hypothetical protein PHAVU_003G215600 [Phaseolus vulgaris]|uniref:DUF7054 domain-containing protein n=1 Tax=Phaseolus vulgaris TaxID=3885 RepID=V7CBQ8_PHAVU|nr:hypothetical protein PHAVU_003G215600g [Phaseolus vulgaris]ESW27594.1 hypothetical protein PHAVU_003G215600g [Phaseolus vulgaris]